MAEDKVCALTELPEQSCYHCKRKARNGRFIDALYPGHCDSCSNPINVGQRIRELPNGRYEHAGHRA